MGEPEELFVAVVVFLAIIGLERLVLRRLLIPCARAVDWLSEKVFKPFSWVYEPLKNGIKHFRDQHFGKVGWIRKLDAIDGAAALRPLGGLWKLLSMAFCLVVSIIIFLALMVTHNGNGVGGDLVMSLPVFAVFDVFFENPFAYEALLQLALFSVLSVGFMERNAETTDGVVTAVYDLIFTGFCTCALYVVPQVFYRLPVMAVSWCRSFTAACSEIPVVNVLVWIVAIPLFLVVGYVIACTYLLALREVLESLAYSLIPLTLFFVSLVFLQAMGLSERLMVFLCCALLLLCCWLVGVSRVRGKKKAQNPQQTRRRFGFFRRR